MAAYYNEIDPGAAAWLRELIKANLIAAGDVDERSIEDVTPDDIKDYTQCHFFAGIGVWSYALRLAGWSDDRPVWTGSCPCQPFSAAGDGDGADDERHLWPHWHHLIGECRPAIIFGEQVASKGGLGWLDLVSSDLEGAKYIWGAADLCAAGFGQPHIRQRLYFGAHDAARLGNAGDTRSQGHRRFGKINDAERREVARRCAAPASLLNGESEWLWLDDGQGFCRPVEPGSCPVVDGAAARVVRLRGYGNAIVAQVAANFIGAFCDAAEVA